MCAKHAHAGESGSMPPGCFGKFAAMSLSYGTCLCPKPRIVNWDPSAHETLWEVQDPPSHEAQTKFARLQSNANLILTTWAGMHGTHDMHTCGRCSSYSLVPRRGKVDFSAPGDQATSLTDDCMP